MAWDQPRELRAQRLLVDLVAETCPEAVLVEFDETPEGGYVFRVEIPGEIGKDLQISKRLVHAALRDRGSLAAVRQMLKFHFLHLVSRRTVNEARAIRSARPRRALMLGVVRELDPSRRIIVVGDIALSVSSALSLVGLSPGMVVSVTWREAGGRREAIALRWRPAS